MNAATCVEPAWNISSHQERRPPRWSVRVAHLIPLLVLPSALWRIALVAGFSLGASVDGTPVSVHGGEAAYILGLSLVTEALALLSLGLVRPWGEVVPSWMPLIGGRRVPPLAAIVPGTVGAVLLTVMWTFATVNLFVPSRNEFDFTSGWWQALLVACYLPNLLWGPLLLVLVGAYHRRRGRS
ncbi:hypothetical protein [Plantactinospora sp. GCM10030261]|uniref:hypothetical protein n=1 Tax=Plantactinospora sp. GCM10030261 TaxID=3273420 RepID=UPI003617A2CA